MASTNSQAFSGGDGTAGNPYQVSTRLHLEAVKNFPAAHYILLDDIDLQAAAYTQAIIPSFTGTFDGRGFMVKSLTINGGSNDYVGLFGQVGSGGVVKNLAVGGNISGRSYVGGLAGKNSSGSIKGCYFSGAVTGSTSYTGGLAGQNSGGSITDCFAMGSVTGSSYVGGLTGYNTGTIRICYSTASVVGSSSVGGLSGYGTASLTINSFWDTQTSGRGTSAGGTGKTTVQMQTMSTFADAGWFIADFDGIDADWIMAVEGASYPQLIRFAYRAGNGITPLAGDGTPGNPYKIGTAADMVSLTEYGSIWHKHIILTSDLDMSGLFVRPIGNSAVRFTGTFDGQGFVIRNLTINLPNKDNVGLFGCLGDGGEITGLTIENIDIYGMKFVGGLVGYNSKGLISNCDIAGYVEGGSSSFVGGLVGMSLGGEISNCRSSADVSGQGGAIGGLVGGNSAGSIISNSSASGWAINSDTDNSGTYTGGLVGCNSFGEIIQCSASGILLAICKSSNEIVIGGLVGENSGTVTKSYAKSDVHIVSTSSLSAISSGGLFGLNNRGTAESCYSSGNVYSSIGLDAVTFSGGVLGLNFEGLARNCYSSGAVVSNESNDTVGGFAGLNLAGKIYGCFWDAVTSGRATSAGGKGLTTSQMKTMRTFQNANWQGKGWNMDDGHDYPRLDWEGVYGEPIGTECPITLNGSGTPQDPYQIWTVDDFMLWNQYASVLGMHTILMADLDLYAIAADPIGAYAPFTGTFDGNGHVIKNITIAEPTNSYVGFFAYVGEGGVIKDLGIAKACITGSDYVGGLVGYNDGGEISRCFITGNVEAIGDYLGGLVGENCSGAITNSYSNMTVVGSCFYNGGFVGQNSGKTIDDPGIITNCYSTGAVIASENKGGFVGYNTGYCEIKNSFWDTQRSGQTAGVVTSGLTGKTTAQMQSSSTFTAAGWNYALVWKQLAGTYPILQWQTFAADLNADGVIDAGDILILAENWLEHGHGLQADINDDGAVDLLDYAMFAQQVQL